ncbi:caspase family protein [Phyllobacterium chamaecytisi]|uniref:caspase family protein n=1 Tax=Phyllobacterium chamaecytisi TaxID=2876082 RepID=UPI001CCDE811|nr:caspase family protein [Phyllobacterium sp. KW56]MBZ9603344.1 caspase family protein [Phyllobacterium sp. KW56]
MSSKFDTGYALIVGVANYSEMEPLPEAVLNDAQDLQQLLTSTVGFPFENVTCLCDHEATRSAIRTALADLALRTRADDTVIVYFSGHGVQVGANQSSALVPYDYVQTECANTVIGEADLDAALSRISARRLLVILDACHAGGLNNNSPLREGWSEGSLERLVDGRSRVLIASSRASETSIILPNGRNSVFTAGLLEALKGGAMDRSDGATRVFDVFKFVSSYVQEETSQRQHPIFKTSVLEDDFAIGRARIALVNATNEGEDADVWASLESTMTELYPSGPIDEQIWLRAGGDLGTLRLGGSGRSSWFSALRTLRLGGGGKMITLNTLLAMALTDFPRHQSLLQISARAHGR